MDVILNGIITGVVLAFLVGPVFFTILQTSIERGFLSGLYVAMGVSLSDAFYIFISFVGLSQFMQADNLRHYMAYGGGVVLLCFGGYYLFVKSRKLLHFEQDKVKTRSPGQLIAKGFIINGLSPMVLFFWIATVAASTTQFGYHSVREASTYFAAIVATVFVTDLLKAKLADKLRRLITPRFIRVMNIVLGLVLVIFAGRLILFPDNIPH